MCHGLAQLRVLNLFGCKGVTSQQVQRLKQALHKCYILLQ